MSKILTIFVCLILISCDEPEKPFCMSLIFSDSLPIKIWVNDEESFNEEEECMIEKYCFNQEFECNDNIRWQMVELDDEGDYTLKGYGDNGFEVLSLSFEKSVSSVFLQPLIDAVNDDFLPDGPSHQPWTVGTETPSISISSPTGSSAYLFLKLYGLQANTDYNFDFSFLRGISGTGTIAIYVVDQAFYDSGVGTPLGSHALSGTNGTFEESGTFAYVGTPDVPAYIMVDVFNVTGTTSAQINQLSLNEQTADRLMVVHSLSFTANDMDLCDQLVKFKILDAEENEVARTDAVRFSNDIACNIFMRYKNSKNFNGLVYNDDSEFFEVRIPGIFYHQSSLITQASIALSDSKVLSRAWAKEKKKRAQIQDCPYYKHDQIESILAHGVAGTLEINGVNWIIGNGDEYKRDEDSPDSYPFRRAEVLLTRKNYFKQTAL